MRCLITQGCNFWLRFNSSTVSRNTFWPNYIQVPQSLNEICHCDIAGILSVHRSYVSGVIGLLNLKVRGSAIEHMKNEIFHEYEKLPSFLLQLLWERYQDTLTVLPFSVVTFTDPSTVLLIQNGRWWPISKCNLWVNYTSILSNKGSPEWHTVRHKETEIEVDSAKV